MPMSDLMQMASQYGGGRSGRLSDLLRGMPDTNNGSTMGGIASVLQKALLGYQMGTEQQSLKDTMEGATAALQSRPGAQDAPGPVPSQGDSGFVPGMKSPMQGDTYTAGYDIAAKAPDTKLAANLLMQNPETSRMGFQMVTQNMAYDEAQKRAAEDRAMRVEDRNTQQGFQREMMAAQQTQAEKMFGLQAGQGEKMARLQAALAAGNRLPQSPIAVLGPDGKPQYVAPGDAYGRQPYDHLSPPTGFMPNPAGGLMPIPGGPADQRIQANMAKPLPVSVNDAMLGDVANLRKIDQAIASVNASPESTGFLKGIGNAILPGDSLNRLDPAGTDARARIGEVGAVKLHDLSGAAVTASEFPRLKPFVPNVGDSPATVQTKLQNFRKEYEAVLNDRVSSYGPDQGYKPNPAVQQYMAERQRGAATGNGGSFRLGPNGEGYAELPKGAQYVGPDGIPRVK